MKSRKISQPLTCGSVVGEKFDKHDRELVDPTELDKRFTIVVISSGKRYSNRLRVTGDYDEYKHRNVLIIEQLSNRDEQLGVISLDYPSAVDLAKVILDWVEAMDQAGV